MARLALAATLLLLTALLLLPAPATAGTSCTGAGVGPSDTVGVCTDEDSVSVYRCTRVNCQVLRVPIPPVT